MAKKIDFRLDDFNVDSNLSLPDFNFDLPEPPNKGRKPTTQVAKGVVSGIKKTAMSDSFIKRAIEDTLPKGFGAAYEMGQDIKSSFENLYNTTAQDLKPYTKSIKRTLNRLVPDAEKYVSQKWADRLKKLTADEDKYSYRMMSADEWREQSNQRELAEIFTLGQQADAARDEQASVRDQIRTGMEERRHRDSTGLLSNISLSLQQMLSYQNKVTYNYQRKDLELKYRMLGVQTDLLAASTQYHQEAIRRMDAIVTNTGLPEYTKLKNSERIGEAMRSNLFGGFAEGIVGNRRQFAQELGGRISKKVRDQIASVGMGLQMGLMNADQALEQRDFNRDMGIQNPGMAHGAGQLIGSQIPNVLSAKLGRRIRSRLGRNRYVGKASNQAQYVAENYRQMMTEWARGDAGERGWLTDPLVRGLKNSVLEGRARRDVSIDSVASLQQPMPFSRAANKSIVEIIPGLLSSIHQELKIMRTGDASTAKTVYDFSRNRFTDEKTARSNMLGRIIDKRDKESVKRDIDSILNKVDPNKTLSEDARVQLGRQMLRDNMENRLASPEALQKTRRYTGDAKKYAGEYSRLFGDYFANDQNQQRKLEFAQAYGGLGRYLQTGRSTIQDLVNLGQGDMLDKTGILPNDSRGSINLDKMYQYYYGDVEEEGSQAAKQSEQVRQLFGSTSTGERGGDIVGGIVGGFRDVTAISTQAIVEAINNLQHQLAQGVRTVPGGSFGGGNGNGGGNDNGSSYSGPDDGPMPPSGGGGSGGDYRARFGAGFDAVKAKFANMSMPDFTIPSMSVPNMGGFAAGASATASDFANKGKGFMSSVGSKYRKARRVGRLFGGAGKLGFRGLKGMRNFANSSVDQAFSTAWKIGKPLATMGGKTALSLAAFGLPKIPGILKGARNFANSVVDDAQKSIGRIGSAAATGWRGVENAMAQDIFSAATGKKLLNAASLRAGSFISSVTGKRITKPEDIDGPVLDDEGNEVISQEDIDGGLVDSAGNRIRSAMSRLGGIGASAAGLAASGAMKGAKFLTNGLEQGVGNAAGLMKNTVGKLFGGLGFGGKSQTILKEIRDILDERLPGKKDPFDFTGDGIREGSFEDIQKRRKEAAEGKSSSKKDDPQAASSKGILGALAALFGGKKPGEEAEAKDGDNIFVGGGGDGADKKGKGGAAKPKPKGFWGKAKHMAGRGLGALGGLATGALGLLGVPAGLVGGAAKAAGAAGKMGIKGVLGAGRLLGMAATGIVSVLGLPVTLGILGAGAAGYGLYKLFSGGLKMNPVNKMRFAQYGFNADEDKKLEIIYDMEKKLEKSVSWDGHRPEIKPKEEDIVEFIKSFGVNTEDEGQINRWVAWFTKRFKPIFLTSLAILKRISGKTSLDDADGLPDEKKSAYIDGAAYPGGPYDVLISPFPDAEKLMVGPEGVEKAVKEAKDSVKGIKPSGTTTGTGAAVGGAVAGAAVAGAAGVASAGSMADQIKASQEDGKKAYRDRMTSRAFPGVDIDAKSIGVAAGAAAGTGIAVAGTLPPTGVSNDSKVSALRAVRYKAYGLTEMSLAKVNLLEVFEDAMEKYATYDGKSSMTWSGTPMQIAREWSAAFNVADDVKEEIDNWLNWFNSRFLAVFTNYLTYIKKATDKETIKAGEPLLKPIQAYEAAMLLKTTKTIYGKSYESIWNVSVSPWPDYEMNTDSKSIQSNLDWLNEQTKKTVLAEDGGNDTSSSKKSSAQKTEEKSWWAKLWSRDDKPTQVLDPNNPKPGDAAGFSSTAGGAAIGYGRRGHQQTSPGSQDVPVAAGGAGTVSNGTLTGGSAAGAMTEGTGGAFQELPSPQGEGTADSMRALISAAAKKTGTPEDLMMTMAAIESGFRPAIKAPTSSATGLYQFIKSTWDATLRKYGSKYGIPMDTPPTDPKANALMGGEFLKENMRALQSVVKGREITDTDLYIAHFLGAGGAKQLLGADPNAIAAQLMPAPARANKSIFYQGERPRTIAEVYQVLNTLVQRKGKQFGLKSGGSAAGVTGGGSGAASTGAADSAMKTAVGVDPGAQGGGGGYGGSVDSSKVTAPVEQTPGAVGATGVASSTGGGMQSTGAISPSAMAPQTPNVPSMEEQAANQVSVTTRQQDLQLQQQANSKNMTQSMTGVEEISRQLLTVNTTQLTVLQAMLEIMQQGGVSMSAANQSMTGANTPSNANQSVTSSQRTNQTPRPSLTSPVTMQRKYA